MKRLSLVAIMLCTIIFSQQLYAQTAKSETIKVWGNCGMCKKRIEKSAKSAGAITASWDAEKLELQVTFDEKQTSSISIQQAIANAGYDTQDITADDKAYNKLSGCCKYERKAPMPYIINSNH
jgi:TusA-related sulfurtransferase